MKPEATIEAHLRTETGKGPGRRLRATGAVPAVLYGPKIAPLGLSLDRRAFSQFLDRHLGESPIVDVNLVEGDKSSVRKVAIKEVQRDPVTDRVVHVDLYEFDLTKPIVLRVPVHIDGNAYGVTQTGGFLQWIARELTVRALPKNIPRYIVVTVTDLHIGQGIAVQDLAANYPDLAFEEDGNKTVVTVLGRRKMSKTEEEAAAPAAAAEAPAAEGATAEAKAE